MLDIVLNSAKTTPNINLWQVATPFITATASFGAVYFGAWLTDKRREKEQHKININKAIILHTLIELQAPALIDYRDNTLIPKLKAIRGKVILPVRQKVHRNSAALNLRNDIVINVIPSHRFKA